MFKRILCCLCCVLMAVLPVASMAEASFTMAGYDGEDSSHDWNNNGFFTRMQERTGVSFTFAQYNKESDWQKAKDAMFAEGGQLPDVLFKAALTTSELIRYTESGQLIDLKPLLEETHPICGHCFRPIPTGSRPSPCPAARSALCLPFRKSARRTACGSTRRG